MLSVRRSALFAFIILVNLTAPALAEHGRTAGAFNVSGGSATYTIPIWTPPGPNGIQPSIALQYNSQSGNGLGGVGWSLSAISSIERCNRTIGQDGFSAGIDLSTADRYCINGNRMRLQSGTYGAAGSVYYTELADYSRITAFGAVGTGPQYFVVEAKSGLKYEYGATTDSRVFVGVAPGFISTTPARWMLNKVYDRSGNKYVVSYNNSNGFAVPDLISWTPTSWGASTYRYEAKFNYINNRTDLDSYLGKVFAHDVANRYRLESIQIKSAGVVKRKYLFTYDTSAVTSRSRLTTAKECADDAATNCFLPITFAYQTGVAGVTAGGGAPPAGSSNSIVVGRYDFNGDGKHDIAYWNGTTWSVAFSTNSGFSSPYNTGITGSVKVDNFLPTGRAAFLALQGGGLWTYRWDDASSSFVSNYTGIAAGLPTTVMDFNGDRMADLVYYSGGTAINVRMNTSSGSGNPSFGSLVATAQLTGNQQYAGFQALRSGTFANSDVNGDGRNDVRAQIVLTGMGGGAQYTTYLYGSSVGFDVPPQAQWTAGTPPTETTLNFNGDRCADKQVSTFGISISSCATSAGPGVPLPATPKLFLDWDGDGKMDLAVDSGGTLGIYRSTGVGFSSLISTSIPSTGSLFAMDQDGDGLDDLIRINGTSAVSYWTHTSSGVVPTFATNVPDLLSGVTDGFGVSHSPNYTSTAAGSYDKGATTNAPLQESKPKIVVAQVSQSNGIGGTFNRSFYYVGARDNAQRDGSAGFQRIDETDSRNGLIARAYFEQAFPVTGMLSQQEIMQSNGVTPISRVVYTNGFATLSAAANNQRYFTYPQASTATQFEVGGGWNGSLLRTVTSSNTFDTASGALYDQTITTTEPASGANGVTGGGVWTRRTYSPIGYLVSDSGNWCLGRPGRTQQINSHNLTYSSTLTRTTDTTWDSVSCRPTQTIDEPGDANLQVTTAIGYDTFGNVSSTTVTGVGMASRTSSAVYSDATYQTGQFPLSQTNALSQSSMLVWNYDLGVLTSVTDPNGLAQSWLYDAWGRATKETRTDGTATTWSISSCTAVGGGCVSSLNKTAIVETELTNIGGTIKDTTKYLDQFDRSIVGKGKLLSGAYNRIDREYDALGRAYRQSAPCIWGSCTNYWSTNTYDLAGRLTQTARPVSDSNPTLQYSYVYYEGLTTRAVDSQSKQSSQTANAVGELARSTDHDGYYQSFDYDAFGLPKRVTDSASNTLQTSTFNVRGMLTVRTDMDMGTWSFTPNALGEVVSQTDAKSQSTSFVFDALGRLTSRTEAEGTSTWTWGTSSANKNIGRLESISGPGYSEAFTYTPVALPVSRLITAGGSTYLYNYGYNSQAKLDSLTYPTSTSGYRLKLKFDYQNGELLRIKDFNAPTTIFWTANASDARGLLTQETLGNGLVTNRAFDGVTGRLKTIQTGPGGGTGIQNLAYTWDLAGNLGSRKDVNQSNLTETFFYDNLYRLDYSQLNGVTNLDLAYNALGNITSKSDVGNYTYHATKKHQVASTSNGWSFAYDNNGNTTSGRGYAYEWTSYNYPSCIRVGASCSGSGDWSSFSYTPDRQYWRQISNYTSGGNATTIYAGGLMEKVTTSAGTDYRHLIPAGGSTIIVSRQSSGTNSVYYVTRDHLASSSAITNSAGAMLVNSSFDAFGKRRGSNWSGSPNGIDWTNIAGTTRRGYTDHSMLDNLGLIHMNGRLQDPSIGGFTSADPYVANAGFTQSYNRYSYVTNNPLTFVDPSGFLPDAEPRPDDLGDDITSTYWRDPERDAGNPDGDRSGPCTDQFGFTIVTTFQCSLVTSQFGMGSAHADAAAAEYRRQEDRKRAGKSALPTDRCWNGTQGNWKNFFSGMLREIGNDASDLLMAGAPSYISRELGFDLSEPFGYDNSNLGILGSEVAFIPETLAGGGAGRVIQGGALRGSRQARTSFSHGIAHSAAPWLPRTVFNGRVVPNVQHMRHDMSYYVKGGTAADKYHAAWRFLDRIPPIWRGLLGAGALSSGPDPSGC
jgi:RHS repeat-associated protein